MTDISNPAYPLVYKAAVKAPVPPGLGEADIAVRTSVRALTGMQKEALVYYGPAGCVWRMVSDEGPYLNGTDLAPFPLAFFTAGMAFSFMDKLLQRAGAAGVTVTDLQLIQDNFYTMQGSALKGNMIGGALPVEMVVEMETDASEESVRQLVAQAEKASPAQRYLSQTLTNRFALYHNGRIVPVVNVAAAAGERQSDPAQQLAAARPLPENTYAPDIITKVSAAETVFGIEGGAGSSLQATQKRTLHVRGICTVGQGGLKEVMVQLFKPLGSTFRFLGDDTGQERAPASLAFLAAGIGFCFMTQIGRYAAIVKHTLKAYSLVQDTCFQIKDGTAVAEPVETHTFLYSDEPDAAAQKMVTMSERTCFLHAAMRGATQTRIKVVVNGRLVTP